MPSFRQMFWSAGFIPERCTPPVVLATVNSHSYVSAVTLSRLPVLDRPRMSQLSALTGRQKCEYCVTILGYEV
ncbi:hypothetical protein Rhow_002985 [Rhodococcus wratislaviensis]|uniref:Uncharacterized protein n=1 Tax=Rhodococcus wratislaviensis TaxID=44752 RepID=A0A402C782_RHOWR|nr:hypothetical protein Rhow_002985 [Rhodococcus wratislaviensis]